MRLDISGDNDLAGHIDGLAGVRGDLVVWPDAGDGPIGDPHRRTPDGTSADIGDGSSSEDEVKCARRHAV
jgi:hypothetical protein